MTEADKESGNKPEEHQAGDQVVAETNGQASDQTADQAAGEQSGDDTSEQESAELNETASSSEEAGDADESAEESEGPDLKLVDSGTERKDAIAERKMAALAAKKAAEAEGEDAPSESAPQQAEMPFAVVEGEAVTQLPQDLYIPPQALEVFLEAFAGPLDLLLYLIRRQNMDILDIPIAQITDQYVEYIELMTELQLDLVGEYLLMAAMLAEIKSRMLLPRATENDEEDEDDPRAELVRRLLEYERFKGATDNLVEMPRMERDIFPANIDPGERKVVTKLPDTTLNELLVAFRDVLSRQKLNAHHHIQAEALSVRERMTDVLDRVEANDFTAFTNLFDPEEGRMGATVTLLAVLELLKASVIEIVQAEPFDPIHVRATGSAEEISEEHSAEADSYS